jgi:hypothetical protein
VCVVLAFVDKSCSTIIKYNIQYQPISSTSKYIISESEFLNLKFITCSVFRYCSLVLVIRCFSLKVNNIIIALVDVNNTVLCRGPFIFPSNARRFIVPYYKLSSSTFSLRLG